MKLKTVEIDGNTYAELQDGKPLYVHDDGKEIGFDAPVAAKTISRLNYEAQSHRQAKDSLEKQVKAFEGIEDPAAALKALETVANLDAKKLVDAGEIETVKTEISKAFQAQLDDANTKIEQYEGELYAEKIGGAFSRSKLIADKFAIPADFVQARFGEAFKIEEGKVVAYDANGSKVFSRERPGELASFDEALEVLVDQYPHKDQILRANNLGGMGSNGSGGGGHSKVNRADMSAEQVAAFVKENGREAYLKLPK